MPPPPETFSLLLAIPPPPLPPGPQPLGFREQGDLGAGFEEMPPPRPPYTTSLLPDPRVEPMGEPRPPALPCCRGPLPLSSEVSAQLWREGSGKSCPAACQLQAVQLRAVGSQAEPRGTLGRREGGREAGCSGPHGRTTTSGKWSSPLPGPWESPLRQPLAAHPLRFSPHGPSAPSKVAF